MQNKANFQKAKMNVNLCLANDYEKNCFFGLTKNKANQSQFFSEGNISS